MAKSTPAKGQQSLLSFFSKSPKLPRSDDVRTDGPDPSHTLTTPPTPREPVRAKPDLPSSPLARVSGRKRAIESDDEDDELSSVPVPKQPKELMAARTDNKKAKSDVDRSFKENTPSSSPLDIADIENAASSSNSNSSGLARFDAHSAHTAPPITMRAHAPTITPEGRYHWILNPKDADGNPPDSPEYDPRTIYIPSSAWTKFTAFEKQYWEIKGKLWDTIVFFKKGKFYELYEKDALIGHSQFDLRLAGGGRANMQCAGIPEMSFDYWASAFIAKGYKVAKVDQKETALAKEMRDTVVGKKEEKIIKRELSFILTAGTLTDETMLVDDLSQYCMAIKQQGTQFAIAFVDTATGAFYLSSIVDDEDLNQFETLVAQTRPRELILARGNLSRYAEKIIRNNSSVDTVWNIVKPEEEFWDAEKSIYELASAKYFGDDVDEQSYPEILSNARSCDLLISTFGALMCYLRVLKLDQQLISLGNFNSYSPVQKDGPMVLDGQTLQNLEVFANTYDQSTEGTLLRLVNKCLTPFGKRRLKSWISAPLQDLKRIEKRQDAVDLLINQPALLENIQDQLSGLADVERMLSRIHAGHLAPKDFARVVRSIQDMNALRNFILANSIPGLLTDLCEQTPNIDALVEEWLSAFDHAKASQSNTLVPEPGVEPEFDATKQKITDTEAELEQCLKTYRKQFDSLAVCYRDSGKEIYLIEIPAKVKSVPDDWQQMAATKQVKRYWSPEVRALVRQLQEAQEVHKLACEKVQQKLYVKFNTNYSTWLAVTAVTAEIDCLVSLAKTSLSMPTHCRPVFKDSTRAHVKFTDLVHPCNTNFIPNDIELGGDTAKLSLLTGANAAGKSTVLRSTGCAIILAQIGCHVPASAAELSPIDRIMTRLGANDNIFAGKSTFHVELSETQRILSEATPNSLVVIDELGRGGSSSDGFAIAESVLHHLATHIGCIGFFATHYGTLLKSFLLHPEVKPERMAIIVDQESREVTFLYKLEAGQSEGSFGMNVASMCGVDTAIVEAAQLAAQTFEHTQRLYKLGYQGMPIGVASDVVSALRTQPSEDQPNDEAVRIMLKIAASL